MELFALSLKVKEEGMATVKSATDKLRLSLNSLNLGALLAGAGLAALAKNAIGTADQMRLLEGRLKLVTGSAAELKATQDALLASANMTRTSYADAVELFARVARSTRDLGMAQSDLLRFTELTNMAVKSSGATSIEASNALIQLSQGLASGQLRGEEFRSVMEQVPGLALQIAAALGVTVGQLRVMANNGQLTAQSVIGAVLKMEQAIRGDFAKAPVTVADAFVVLRNAVGQVLGEVNRATGATNAMARAVLAAKPLLEGLGRAVVMLADALDYAVPLAIALGGALVASKWALIVSTMGALGNTVMALGGAFTAAAGGVTLLNGALSISPIGALVAGFGVLTATVLAFATQSRRAAEERDAEVAKSPEYIAALEAVRQRREALTAAEKAAGDALARANAESATRIENLVRLAGFTTLTAGQTRELRLAAQGYETALRSGNVPLSQRLEMLSRLAEINAAVAASEAVATSAARARAQFEQSLRVNRQQAVGTTVTGLPSPTEFAQLIPPRIKPLVDAAAVAAAELRQRMTEAFATGIAGGLADGIAAGFERGFATGKLGEGFKALAGTLLSGLGSALIQFGTAGLMASKLMAKLKASLASLNPAAGVGAALAMIALGGTLKGVASAAFGGMGGQGTTPVTQFGTQVTGQPSAVSPIVFGPTSATTAAGMTPRANMNVTIIGPNDPVAQRQLQELMRNANQRGTLG